MAGEKEKEFKEKIEKLSSIICETAPGMQHCSVVDFVADLANMVMFAELNKKLLSDRMDKFELLIEQLILKCSKLERSLKEME